MSSKATVEAKKGGPYTKYEKEKLQEKVYEYYFDYGYSERKISVITKITRGTVSRYVNSWYKTAVKNQSFITHGLDILASLERLEMQRARKREELDKTVVFKERMALDRFIFDIESKILSTNQRLYESSVSIEDRVIFDLNTWMKQNGFQERYLEMFDKMKVSTDALEKINKIIEEDAKQLKAKSISQKIFSRN